MIVPDANLNPEGPPCQGGIGSLRRYVPRLASGSSNSGFLKHLGAYTGSPPAGIGDALALPVGVGHLGECLLQCRDIHFIATGTEFVLKVRLLLDQVQPGEGTVSAIEFATHYCQSLLDRLRRALSTSFRACRLERIEVVAHDATFLPALGQGSLVGIGHL